MSRRKRGPSRGRGRGRKEKKVFPQVTGKVQMTREGFAFVIVEGEDDVFVKASKTRGALNGDIVRVAVTREKLDRQRREGEVVEILERSPRPFIGVLHIVGQQAWVLMQSRFMPYDIAVPFTESDKSRYRRHKVKGSSLAEPKDDTGCLKCLSEDLYAVHNVFAMKPDGYGREELTVRSGMKVAAVVESWPKGEPVPRGRIVDVLGDPGENDTEMHSILAEYALPYRFEPEVANAADMIPDVITADDLKGRKDFRNVLTFTIDPADAKDFDDALSYRKLENGNHEVGVHIADVTHYVRPGSIVDEEARLRGTSVYLVDRTVPMLPEKLCNKLCSLRPHEEKLTFSAVFELTPLGKIAGSWFGKTVIYSDRRFSYEEAQAVIDDPKGDHEDLAPEVRDALLCLHGLASRLRKKRFASGAISFERPEMKVLVDEKGRPVDVYQKVSREANWLIEEFMLLANRCVAEFVATGCRGTGETGKGSRRKAKTFVYRVHDEPNQEKIEALRGFVGNFGYRMGATGTGKEISKELNALFAAAKDTPEYNAIELLSLRTMAKARYDVENLGHYGLAFKYYTHFTSPIRRYPDMLVHRLLAEYLAGGPSADEETYAKLCKYASEREVVAAEAERASIKYKLVEFMQDKVGYEFEGHVSGLTEWGMYVEVEPTKIEGMVPLRDIRSDFFEFDAERYRLVGRRTGVVYNLGDSVRIRVKRTDLEQKLLDYELVDMSPDERVYDRIDYEYGRGTSFIKGTDGAFDNVTVGINKAARKEKIRKAIQDSKRNSKKKSRKG